jgi:beta-1,4-N-acetylglucosaminyltransferase
MIYATVGTMFMDFPRLINAMDDIARVSGEEVIIQIGMSELVPKHAEYFSFKDRDDVLEIQSRARAIVCHAGIGAVQDALSVRRPFAVVPRLKRHGEHMNDHQLDLARGVVARGWGRMVLNCEELPEFCAYPPPPPAAYAPSSGTLIAAVRNDIAKLLGDVA